MLDRIKGAFGRIGGEVKEHPIVVIGVLLTGVLVYIAWRNRQSGASATGASLPVDPLWNTATGGSQAASGNPLTPNPPSSSQPSGVDLSSLVPQPPQFSIDPPTPPGSGGSSGGSTPYDFINAWLANTAGPTFAQSDVQQGGYTGSPTYGPAVSLTPSDAGQGGYGGSFVAPAPTVSTTAFRTASPSVLSRIGQAVQGVVRSPANNPAPVSGSPRNNPTPLPGVPAHLGMHYQ